MAKNPRDNIITLPNPHLRQRSKKIGLITPEVRKLIASMEAAVKDWDKSREHEVTVAFAAVQIDKLYRVIIVRDDFEHKTPARYSALINPVVVKVEGDIERDYEGCLSIQHIYGHVPRHNKVRIKALDINGKEVRVKAEGFLARVLQHEIDHMNGRLFIDHIKDDPQAFFKLKSDGHLEQLDYEKDVRDNRLLW
ncbi:MAG: peptide deformylase [Candidatus Saccharibacteria bacterium]|nr:peptide deformylase [Candidatus Saccharibacteria bacterium]